MFFVVVVCKCQLVYKLWFLCGVGCVQVLDRGVVKMKVVKMVIGYNVDDVVEIILFNIVCGDIVR